MINKLTKKNNEKKIKSTTPEPIRFIKQLNSNITEEKTEKKVELQKRKEKKTSTFKKRKNKAFLGELTKPKLI